MDKGRTNRSPAAKVSRTLENALQYVRGTGQWFSARNETAVVSQLIEAQKELDKLAAVVEAAWEIVADAVADDELNNWATVILASALAALDSEGSE